MTIYLVRHGETEYNEKGIIQGNLPVVLNKKGENQCKRLREQIKDINFDICFSSPLVRTMQTAMILVGERVLIQPDKRLIERDLKELVGKSVKEYNRDKLWNYKLNYTEHNIEKVQDLFKRSEDFLEYLKNNYLDKTILIISHSSVIRCLHFLLTKEDLISNIGDYMVENAYLEKMEI